MGAFFTIALLSRKKIREIIAFKDRMAGKKPKTFVSDLLGHALVARHFRFLSLSESPSDFGFISNRTLGINYPGYSLSVKIPDFGWIAFSYDDIVRPKTEFDLSLFTKMCRQWFAQRWRPLKVQNECSRCKSVGDLDVDHIDPPHAEIRTACWELLNSSFPDLKEMWWQQKQTLSRKRTLYWPDDHPVTQLYDYLSEGASYQTLCKPCHRLAHRERRFN